MSYVFRNTIIIESRFTEFRLNRSRILLGKGNVYVKKFKHYTNISHCVQSNHTENHAVRNSSITFISVNQVSIVCIFIWANEIDTSLYDGENNYD